VQSGLDDALLGSLLNSPENLDCCAIIVYDMANDIASIMNNVFLGGEKVTLNTQAKIAMLVREVRERTGLTQEKLAAKLGVTFPTVNRWEHGRTKPSPLAMQRIKELISTMGDHGIDLLNKYFPEE